MAVDEPAYEFGRFRLDARNHALIRDGARVPIQPKVFEVLLALVANAGRLVTREELTKRLWPDTFVADSTLAQNVWLARKALGKGERSEALIETVPRLGFRFVGEVRTIAPRACRITPASDCRLVWGRKRLPLKDGESVIGRDPDVDIPIENSTVSRQHARIVISAETATLEDLGSKNGTSLHGKKIEGPAVLTDGDVIGIGSLILTFRRLSRSVSTKTARP